MVEKIIYFMVLPFLFFACSTIHNKKYFNFQKSLTEKRIKTDGYYYYKNTDVYLGERRTYIMGRIFLDNGYFHLTGSSPYEDKCKNLNIDCVIKEYEQELKDRISSYKDTDKQSNTNLHIWFWGKYQIVNDTIVMKWFYNHNGDYYLMEEKGVVIDSTSFNIFYSMDYRAKKDTIYIESKKYHFRPYPIEKIYDKIPKKMVQWE